MCLCLKSKFSGDIYTGNILQNFISPIEIIWGTIFVTYRSDLVVRLYQIGSNAHSLNIISLETNAIVEEQLQQQTKGMSLRFHLQKSANWFNGIHF